MYTVDRFESIWAIIEGPDKQTFNLTRGLLPPEAKAGDVITISAAVDEPATKAFSIAIRDPGINVESHQVYAEEI